MEEVKDNEENSEEESMKYEEIPEEIHCKNKVQYNFSYNNLFFLFL